MRKESNMSKQELYEQARELVFLLASDDNPPIKEVGKYLEDAKEIRSNFWDYHDREEDYRLD